MRGKLQGDFFTDEREVTVKVFTYLDIRGPLWFFSSLLCFLLGIFGIFDRLPNRRCKCLSFTVSVPVDGGADLLLRLPPFKNGAADPVVAECNRQCEVSENRYFVDTAAVKRMKIMRAVKILFTLAVFAGIITALILLIFN